MLVGKIFCFKKGKKRSKNEIRIGWEKVIEKSSYNLIDQDNSACEPGQILFLSFPDLKTFWVRPFGFHYTPSKSFPIINMMYILKRNTSVKESV